MVIGVCTLSFRESRRLCYCHTMLVLGKLRSLRRTEKRLDVSWYDHMLSTFNLIFYLVLLPTLCSVWYSGSAGWNFCGRCVWWKAGEHCGLPRVWKCEGLINERKMTTLYLNSIFLIVLDDSWDISGPLSTNSRRQGEKLVKISV